jgi:GT2 family glycosyltransferase
MLDVVVVSYNCADFLRECLASIPASLRGEPVQVFVVDNASRDGTPGMVRADFPHVSLHALDTNIGFGAANNVALRAGTAEFVLFLNPDAVLRPHACEYLIDSLDASPRCVIAGPRLVYPDGRFQPSCRRFPTPLRAAWSLAGLEARFPRVAGLRNWLDEEEHAAASHVDMVSGACFLARRGYLERVGLFDENLFMYEEETDLMLPAARAGESVRFCRKAEVVHHGGATVEASAMGAFSERQLFRSKYVVFRKHYGPFAAWRTHAADRAILGFSALRHRLAKRESIASVRLARVKRAWRESYSTVAALRETTEFFDGES